ncbi:transporter [Curvibacter sp. APW13]|uniref:transporter n=1 Tax=Curvibacter sp. APW13 TaxID=3077236 RepID=UPI0028DD86B9|nr:transporter [Curvibacter sp. APW13]MDT8989901.1 transporter [Curvibacter sp. APW13]
MSNEAATASEYGADRSGLVFGFHFSADGKPHPLTTQDALNAIADNALDGFLWLHFSLAHASAERWIAENLPVPQAFREALHDASRSTRIELADDTLVAVMNDVSYDFQFEPSDISTLWLSVGPRLVVSARIQPLRSIDLLRNAVRKGSTILSPVGLLVRLMQDQSDVLAHIARTASTKVDTLEDNLLSGRLAAKRADLGTLRRVLVRLLRLLAPEPAALFRLLRVPPGWADAEDIAELRHAAEDFNLSLRDMSNLQERIKLLQEEIAGRVAEANNRSLFVLTVVTVLALPINILAGLFGMNVGGIPFSENPHGFWILLSIVAVFTVIAALLALRYGNER